ncbi:uncharacterized protein CDAR_585611 [Caerostris darwini]|uniref:EF-hand domain-containing protein n=1 Tax=Caerostris darwini TaxID=1538125 RepID=A0AAV4RWA8_9ARAC|nr:uncharacterized protein CDAR_585611 [Caerostris darwini]
MTFHRRWVLSKVLEQGLLPVAAYSEYQVNAFIISHVLETDNVTKSSYESLLELGFRRFCLRSTPIDFNLFSHCRAFDLTSLGHLSLRDVLIGLAAMNPSTPHGGSPAAVRCRYIFRYYGSNNDGVLETSELRECITKCGERHGTKVWNAINDCFDVMPLAAVVHGMIFCTQGGIPPPWFGLINVINEIPKPLSDPEKDSPLAWDLMWNDPVT